VTRSGRRLLLPILLLALIPAIVMLRRPPEHRPDPVRPVEVIAHRGGAGLWPENTLLAFEHALELGADMLEFDVRATRDGHLVVVHDATVDRTTDGSGRVAEMTLEQVRALDAAYRWSPLGGAASPYRGQDIRIPLLEEVLGRFPDAATTIELKVGGAAVIEGACAALGRNPGGARIVASFDAATLREFRRRCPGVPTSAAAAEAREFLTFANVAPRHLPRSTDYRLLQLPPTYGPLRVLTRRLVAAAGARGLAVHAWTINEPAEMRRLVDLGVDGILTDRPDLLLELLGRGTAAGASEGAPFPAE
jgi:glycerophosphoryl diester phosphodiesterase